jgi:hypothetical protein
MVFISSVLAFLLASLAGQYEQQTPPKQEPQKPTTPQSGPQKIEESRMISMSATVVAIDHDSRKVTVRGPQGNTFTFKAGDSVKNLDQVKVGDQIVCDYYESIAIQVVKEGSAKEGGEMVVEQAEPGELPAGAAAAKTTIVATVEKIDRAARTVTLKDQDGNERTIAVRHPERLNLIKVGDTLKITSVEAVAIAVTPPSDSAK